MYVLYNIHIHVMYINERGCVSTCVCRYIRVYYMYYMHVTYTQMRVCYFSNYKRRQSQKAAFARNYVLCFRCEQQAFETVRRRQKHLERDGDRICRKHGKLLREKRSIILGSNTRTSRRLLSAFTLYDIVR